MVKGVSRSRWRFFLAADPGGSVQVVASCDSPAGLSFDCGRVWRGCPFRGLPYLPASCRGSGVLPSPSPPLWVAAVPRLDGESIPEGDIAPPARGRGYVVEFPRPLKHFRGWLRIGKNFGAGKRVFNESYPVR